MRPVIALVLLLMAGCHGPGRVEFVSGQCVIDGRAADLVEVEAMQARISERIIARQPVMVAVTVLIILFAGASHIDKLMLLFSTRRTETHGLGDRIRLALERYRAHPIRYFSIVAATLLLLGVAGGAYVFLDAEKRANERALGLLQFCHVALRNRQADAMLDQQRRNLAHIESTAGTIESLVDRLPPQHKEEAAQIVAQLRRALGEEGRLVNAYAEKSDESTRQLRQHTQLVEHGLSTLETDFSALKNVPLQLHELSEQLKQHDQRSLDEKAKIDALTARLETLTKKSGPQCPSCNGDGPKAVDGGIRPR
jgi:hypothetical protein